MARKASAPDIGVRNIRCRDFVDIVASLHIWPMSIKDPVAIFIDLANVADLESGIFKTEIETSDAGKKRVHRMDVVGFQIDLLSS